jgi:Flp pilus assembly protein TadD
MFGEDALWRYKHGAALAALGRDIEAEAELRKALAVEARKWVHARAHLELGKRALKSGNKAAAATEFRAAIGLADSDNDPLTSDEAKRLLK